MIVETHIASILNAIPPERIFVDEYIKDVLADVQILSRILKYTVSELQELDINEIIGLIDPKQIKISKVPVDPGLTNRNYGKIESNNTESTISGEGTAYFDISFSVYYQEKELKILINLEAQKSISPGTLYYHLENRIIFYLSRLISSQKNVEFFHDDYDSLKKVYSIWICLNPNSETGSIDEFRFTQNTIYGTPLSFPYLDKMHGVVIGIPPTPNTKDSKNALLSMLEDLVTNTKAEPKKQILSEKHGIVITSALERSISEMCNIGEYYIEEAIRKGLTKGMEQGIAQGMAQGIYSLVSTLRELNQSNELILSKVVEKFSLTEEEAMKYL